MTLLELAIQFAGTAVLCLGGGATLLFILEKTTDFIARRSKHLWRVAIAWTVHRRKVAAWIAANPKWMEYAADSDEKPS